MSERTLEQALAHAEMVRDTTIDFAVERDLIILADEVIRLRRIELEAAKLIEASICPSVVTKGEMRLGNHLAPLASALLGKALT